MARDYVSIREEQRAGQTVWTFTSVTHERLKSAPQSHPSRRPVLSPRGRLGRPMRRVEAQVDDGPWQGTKLLRNPYPTTNRDESAWSFWTLDWGTPTPGEHAIGIPGLRQGRKRATHRAGPLPHQPENLLGAQRADHPASAHSLGTRR